MIYSAHAPPRPAQKRRKIMRNARYLSEALQDCIDVAQQIQWRAELAQGELAQEKLAHLLDLIPTMQAVSEELGAEEDELSDLERKDTAILDEVSDLTHKATAIQEKIRKIYAQDRDEEAAFLEWLCSKYPVDNLAQS
jgi:hypothetical protein